MDEFLYDGFLLTDIKQLRDDKSQNHEETL